MKRECAEAVWAKKPTPAAELVASVVDWESIHGSASKLWNDHHKYYHRQQHQSHLKQQFNHNDQMKSPQPAERRDQSRLQQQIGQQHQFGERQSVGHSQQDQGQAGCYNCGETGHFKKCVNKYDSFQTRFSIYTMIKLHHDKVMEYINKRDGLHHYL